MLSLPIVNVWVVVPEGMYENQWLVGPLLRKVMDWSTTNWARADVLVKQMADDAPRSA
jgi:hypothetical protein